MTAFAHDLTQIEAVIFDLDGTLLDSWPSLQATLHEGLNSRTLDMPVLAVAPAKAA